MNHQSNLDAKPPAALRHLAGFIALGILFLTTANGILTYSGALLYVDQPLYALLFALAVQLAISSTLLALPHIRGLGKLMLLAIYAVGLILSTVSGYTYLYNVSQPHEGQDFYALDLTGKAQLIAGLGQALQVEVRDLEARELRVAQLKRNADEELLRGGKSGKGPGRGSEYYQKSDLYDAAEAALQAPRRHLEQARGLYAELIERLEQGVSLDQRQELAGRIAAIRALANTEQSAMMLDQVTMLQLAQVRNPIERAITPLLEPANYHLTLLVSVIWAAIFDVLALFLGIIRYYVLRPQRSMFSVFNDALVGAITFFLRLKQAPSEARLHYHRSHQDRPEPPLNSQDMQRFATSLMAGSELSAIPEGDVVEPLRTLVSYIEPLHLADDANAVGISHARVNEEPRLKPLVSMLLQHQVFVNRHEAHCYLMNSSVEMAHKVMVLMRMGMKSQQSLPHLRGLFPELTVSSA